MKFRLRFEKYLADASHYCDRADEAMDAAGITLADIRDTTEYYIPELIEIVKELGKHVPHHLREQVVTDCAPHHVWDS